MSSRQAYTYYEDTRSGAGLPASTERVISRRLQRKSVTGWAGLWQQPPTMVFHER